MYERLRVQVGELRDRLGGLPTPVEAEGIWRNIWLEEAHHSTALEGNTLVLKQVEALLAEGRAVGSKELREHMEVRGYANAADWVYGHGLDGGDRRVDGLVSLTELRHIHSLAMTPSGMSRRIRRQPTRRAGGFSGTRHRALSGRDAATFVA